MKKAMLFMVISALLVVPTLFVRAQKVTVASKAAAGKSGVVLRPIAGRHGIKVKTLKSTPDYDIIGIELERDPGNVRKYKVPKDTAITATGYSEPPEVPGLAVFSNVTNKGFLYHTQEPGGNTFFLHVQKVGNQKGRYKVEIHLNAKIYRYAVTAAENPCFTVISDPDRQLKQMLDTMTQTNFARAGLGSLANEMLKYSDNDYLPYWVNSIASIFGDLVDVEALYPLVPPCFRPDTIIECGNWHGCGWTYSCADGSEGSGTLGYMDTIEITGTSCSWLVWTK